MIHKGAPGNISSWPSYSASRGCPDGWRDRRVRARAKTREGYGCHGPQVRVAGRSNVILRVCFVCPRLRINLADVRRPFCAEFISLRRASWGWGGVVGWWPWWGVACRLLSVLRGAAADGSSTSPIPHGYTNELRGLARGRRRGHRRHGTLARRENATS